MSHEDYEGGLCGSLPTSIIVSEVGGYVMTGKRGAAEETTIWGGRTVCKAITGFLSFVTIELYQSQEWPDRFDSLLRKCFAGS